MWGEESEEAGSSGTDSEVFQVWRGGTQEVGMSQGKQEEERRDGSPVKCV